MVVTRDTLLSLAHLINYGIGFNTVNALLDIEQRKHFERVGQNILNIRDPFVPYDDGKVALDYIFSLCEITDLNHLYQVIKEKTAEEHRKDNIENIDEAWFCQTVHHAITRYEERCMFFMLEHEYDADLQDMLGHDGAQAFKEGIGAILNKKMVCGNADHAKSTLMSLLSELGDPYKAPGPPYREKHDTRFAVFRAMLREFALKRSAQDKV